MKLTRRVLDRRAKLVGFRYPYQNKQLQQQLIEFMHQNHGIGLAAPQVGIRSRVFVMSIHGEHRVCFNPELSYTDDHVVAFDEACLSFPGEHCIINRPDRIDVRYQDANGAWYSEHLSGLMSRCYQHELDHLDGITMWDRYKEQNAKQS
jgi:peptide deformylase